MTPDVVRIDPNAAVQPDPDNPGEYYASQFEGSDPALTVGVWAADAQDVEVESYPVDEMCVVIAGAITITTATAGAQVYLPGDMFAVRRGTRITWSQIDGTRKVYVILDRDGDA
jgi:uncharacterized cupin superfamily protein